MRYSTQIKPISYVKAHAAEILDRMAETGETMIITQNGEAKAVLQDVATYEQTQETLALLQILALGERDIEAGQAIPAKDVLAEIRAAVRGEP